jgi:D-alanyl-D-alanine carboxypeptidase/D-alanyl-D-alanine-endopeptidase (penicillin-binding protein 4)
MQEEHIKEMSSQLIWKDGCGLSRYNLVTPTAMVKLIAFIIDDIGIEQFKKLVPAGGRDGTLRNYYKPLEGEDFYVFAKTGTLSNVHNLTGVVHTQSGRDLYFSFMNNNYPAGSRPVKLEIEKVLRLVYERY